MLKPQYFIILFIILLFSTCAPRAKTWIKKKIIPDTNSYSISLNKLGIKDLKVLYTGCGGLIITNGNEGIMTDPYYTGHKISKVLLGKIKINPENNERVNKEIQQKIPMKNINAVLIAHSHYDHLEDLPYLLEKNLLNEKIKIVGDTSTYCSIHKFMKGGEEYIFSNSYCYNQIPKPNIANSWVKLSANMRVMIIEANHAPHLGKIHTMRGNTCSNGISGFDKSTDKTKANDWKEGKTYSFLLDILGADKKPELRLFIQSSSCEAPYGFPPSEILKERPVDIAFIGVASAQNIGRYPEDILNYLRPQKVVLIHWEDFFRELYSKKLKSVRGTNIHKFIRHLRKQYNCYRTEELAEWFSMPAPLSWINIKY